MRTYIERESNEVVLIEARHLIWTTSKK